MPAMSLQLCAGRAVKHECSEIVKGTWKYQRASSMDRYVCSVSSRKLAMKACGAGQRSYIGVAMGGTNVAHCSPHRAICHPHLYKAKQSESVMASKR